jgi:hypothetical protein
MSDAKDLLVADLEHFGTAMLHNEDVGEKRFSFFVTLITAVAAGLVTLAAAEREGPHLFREVAGAATASLLVVGLMSYLRTLHRNRVTDEYQRTLKYIREQYAELCPDLSSYNVPLHRKTWAGTWLKGGYAETLAVIEGLLAVGFLTLFVGWPVKYALVMAGVLVLLLWYAAGRRDKNS